jgi:alkylation response protein AidB-like acyl-CoA dehydrogenase
MNALEQRFGDPWDEQNPVGYRAIMAADELQTTPAAGERLLSEYGLGAEFVPTELGGRLDRLDRLVTVLRAVCRRDLALTLANASPFIAAVNVWTAGRTDQRHRVAELLLAGERVAALYHELAHGNDLMSADFVARPAADGRLLLTGRKEVIANVQRAAALIVFARTSDAPGQRSHSQLLLDKASTALDPAAYLPRFRTSGLRGVPLSGIDVRDFPVGADAVVGRVGAGLETVLRSFQLTRLVFAGSAIGALDAGLRTALRFARERRLYGRTALDLPMVRATLRDAFVDLLISDCLSTAATRAVHLLPSQVSAYSWATKLLVPKLLMDAMNRLSRILGAHFYIREGRYAIFGKHLRDLPPVVFGHASRAVCQLALLAELPRLARRAWASTVEPPAALFRQDAGLPPLDFTALSVSASGDALLAGLTTSGPPAVRPLLDRFVAESAALRADCLALGPRDVSMAASPAAFALTTRYATLLAASAALNMWRHSTDPFLHDPAWLEAALRRLGNGIGLDLPGPTGSTHERITTELIDRYDTRRGLDLAAAPIAG